MRSSHGRVTDAGYATVAAAGFSSVLVMLCALLAWHVGAVVASVQAQRAADLAVVAGAFRLATGDTPTAACAVAGQVAHLNDATLLTCDALGEDLVVAVEVRGRTAEARAGPV